MPFDTSPPYVPRHPGCPALSPAGCRNMSNSQSEDPRGGDSRTPRAHAGIAAFMQCLCSRNQTSWSPFRNSDHSKRLGAQTYLWSLCGWIAPRSLLEQQSTVCAAGMTGRGLTPLRRLVLSDAPGPYFAVQPFCFVFFFSLFGFDGKQCQPRLCIFQPSDRTATKS